MSYYDVLKRDAKAIEFGNDHGWRLSKSSHFGWRTLAGVKVPAMMRAWGRDNLPPGCDHTWLFKIKRAPIAIVTFPYPYTIRTNLEAMVHITLEQNLQFEIMSYKLNWYGFGTIMVLWTRKDHDVFSMRVRMGAA